MLETMNLLQYVTEKSLCKECRERNKCKDSVKLLHKISMTDIDKDILCSYRKLYYHDPSHCLRTGTAKEQAHGPTPEANA